MVPALVVGVIAVFAAICVFRVFRSRRAVPAPGSAPSATDTEFSAEIVRITEVRPHPNADRLELLHFEMKSGPASYEVVSQKGTYKVGDLAAYLSVDCIVPLAREEFAFLGERLDGKGKTHYRLRAARLRGVFSQGLLVPGPKGFELGQSVAAEFGVTYHRPEEPGDATTGATTARAPRVQPMPVYSVDSLKKLPNLFADGDPVVVTEKVHGSNGRAGWFPRKFLGIRVGWKFVVGSHRVIKGDDYKPKDASQPGNGHWYGTDVWLATAEKYDLKEKLRPYKGLALYGEVYGYTQTGKKIQDLTYGRKPEDGPGFAVFDAKRICMPGAQNGTWLTFDERWALCVQLKLEHVPVFDNADGFHKWSADLLVLAEGQSLICREQIREGIVVESAYGDRRKAKFVSQQYLLREDGAHRPNPKKYSVSADASRTDPTKPERKRKPQKRVEVPEVPQ